MPEFKPIAHATPDGRVAVYIGAGYQKLPLGAAISLRQQLDVAINEIQVEQAAIDTGDEHG